MLVAVSTNGFVLTALFANVLFLLSWVCTGCLRTLRLFFFSVGLPQVQMAFPSVELQATHKRVKQRI